MRKLFSPAAVFISLLILMLTGCGGGGGGSGSASVPAALAPTVTSDTPAAPPSSAALRPIITATFSEAMKSSSISGTTFKLQGPMGAAVSGTVSYANEVAQFTLAANTSLAANTPYNAIITNGATATNGKPMAADFHWTFTTGTAPTVSFTNPTNGAINVLVNQQITATFSEPMKTATIIKANFNVVGTSALNGTVTYDATNNTAIFTPQTPLTAGDSYTATIAASVQDAAGDPLAAAYTWTFTAGSSNNTTAPTVTSTDPANSASGVPLNQKVAATFSQAMDSSTLNTSSFTLTGPGPTPIAGTVAYAGGVGTTAVFTPSAALTSGDTYNAKITVAATDLAGHPLASLYTWSFIAGPMNVVVPTVTSENPTNMAMNVPLNHSVSATFSTAMDPLSMTPMNFTVVTTSGSNPVAGTLAYDPISRVLTFTPSANLALSTNYTATIEMGVSDLDGVSLAADFIWDFTTINSQPPPVQPPIDLGDASNFAILAGSATTSTGATAITGDVGLNPGSSQGIPTGEINGSVFVGAGAAAAQNSLTNALADAAKRKNPTVIASGFLSGTVVPGLYSSQPSSTIEVNGPVVFDGQGDGDAVFIIQVQSSLTVDNNVVMTMINGAKAKNIYWGVAVTTTIGTDVSMVGSVLAGTSITAKTNSNLNGRLLASGGAVTLDTNAVVRPAP